MRSSPLWTNVALTKGSSGGFLAVLKGRNLFGRLVDGSTGKSYAYVMLTPEPVRPVSAE